ncbi:hypothetical protein MOQ72_27050 [Saccharopolyspora sp. K220]|uniref:DUF6884 domain-containing protein n=1 Tax=Saccharopolyspora soli TaxID=2926618 RepID=UPI001F5789B7|nr:DUF6884 domain-containing protein [Saccharopolyspora soli]MCI2421106.1 hypothetical protein [Saccharopolyspora soli]
MTTTPPPPDISEVVTTRNVLFVVPCGRNKLDRPAPARELYASPHFRFALRQVETQAADVPGSQVRILSALHGLVEPDTELEPYDVSMICENSISATALAVQLRDLCPATLTIEVAAFLPAVYLAALRAAARVAAQEGLAAVTVHDAYISAPGIGYQRRVLARLTAGVAARSR